MRFVLVLFVIALTLAGGLSLSQAKPEPCGKPGEWRQPGSIHAPVAAAALLDSMAAQQVVLLGESHDSAEDHRWQLHTLAQLHTRQPPGRSVALGLEMFPRRLQPVLDQWVAGQLSEQEFLVKSEWDKVWGYDARDYLPLFHYARMHRLPMLAVNVEKSLTEAVSNQGWEAVPESRKEGVSRPAPVAADYLASLRKLWDYHPTGTGEEADFKRFVEAQSTWDRAMAQGMAEHLRKSPQTLVVGILGAGHVRFGHGVAHQLRDLGVDRIGSLLTASPADGCKPLQPGLADAVFMVGDPEPNPPRLGVATEPAAAGLRLTGVTPGSIAEAAGLKKDDVIVEVAGRPATSIEVLRNVVRRQVPGTWLPLKVKRGEQELEVVARFPLAQ